MKHVKTTITSLILSLFWGLALTGQPAAAIPLKNPSFEDAPRHSHVPQGWEDCGFEGETPPDVQPNGEFGVVKEAAHGNTYLGLVLRDNDTWECAAQPLAQPLLADTCYQLVLKACRSEVYKSISRAFGQLANYDTPAVIRIWGGYVDKEKDGFEMLAETEPVANTDWQEYRLTFTSTAPYDYLYVEAYFDQGRPIPYNGNVLVDDLSDIVPCTLIAGNK